MFFRNNARKKIVVLLGHPDSSGDTLSGNLAMIYEAAAKKAGHEVKFFKLYDMHFDSVLHRGYRAIQDLEPDLKNLQEAIRWCDHFVLFYPDWWSGMPAPLKGLFDRMWLPSFAFSYYKTGIFGQLHLWKRLLKHKTSRVFVLSSANPLFIRIFFGDYTNEIKNGILRFAGFRVNVDHFGPSERGPEWLKNRWRERVARLGALGE